MPKELQKKLSGKNFMLINSYGPTEATVWATVNLEGKEIHIGRPFAIYILDEMMQPLPVGAVGELYIGGVGAARGYLNKTELTDKKFVKNIFQNAVD